MLRKIDFEISTEIHILGSPDTEKGFFFCFFLLTTLNQLSNNKHKRNILHRNRDSIFQIWMANHIKFISLGPKHTVLELK